MEKLRSYFFFDYRAKIQSIWFKRLLYTYLIVRSILWLAHFDVLLGEHSIVYSSPKSIGFFKDLAFLLYSNSEVWLSAGFIISLLFLSVLSLVGRGFYFISDFIIWFIVINIHNTLYPSLTGGDLLVNQFLFFNCLISHSYLKTETRFNDLKVLLHNLSIVAIIIQLCLVYFLSGLAKLLDTEWLHGRAIISVSQIRHFSLSHFLNYNAALNPLYIFLNYLVLTYQILFPMLIWIKRTKKALLILGISMHVYIGMVMGLPEFSVVMIIAYVYFWPTKAHIV